MPRRFDAGTKKFIVVFPMLRRRRVVVDQLHPLGQIRILPDSRLQPLHPGPVIVQAQADLGNVRMIVEKLEHGARGGASEREIVAVPPLTP